MRLGHSRRQGCSQFVAAAVGTDVQSRRDWCLWQWAAMRRQPLLVIAYFGVSVLLTELLVPYVGGLVAYSEELLALPYMEGSHVVVSKIQPRIDVLSLSHYATLRSGSGGQRARVAAAAEGQDLSGVN